MIEKIRAYVRLHQMLEQSDTVIAGVSGGADSVCLFFVLLELKKEIGFRLAVVHVHHGLRGAEADQDEAYVRHLCEKFSVSYRSYFFDVESESKKRKQSIEEAGREVRREAFADAVQVFGGTKIALAHHQDDNAETMLLHLVRGSRLNGLGGIRPKAGKYIRPLLCVRRREIEAWLNEKEIHWQNDETNQEDHYTRNRIRHHILPCLEEEIHPGAVEHMNETAEYLRQVQVYLEQQADEAMHKAVREPEEGMEEVWFLEEDAFRKVAAVIQSQVIYRCLVRAAGRARDIEEIHVRMVSELLDRQVGREIMLPYSMKAVRSYGGVSIFKNHSADIVNTAECPERECRYTLAPGEKVQAGALMITAKILENGSGNGRKPPENIYTKWFDYDIIKDTVEVRIRRPGDYLVIDTAGNRQKLKTFFINEKIPHQKRDQIWLIAKESQILWVIGYRMGHTARITEQTRSILEISIYGGEEHGRDN